MTAIYLELKCSVVIVVGYGDHSKLALDMQMSLDTVIKVYVDTFINSTKT